MEYNSSEIVLFIYLFNLSNRMEVEKKYVGLCILQVYIAAKKEANKKRDRLPSPQDIDVMCNLMQVIRL